jgi:hypothetical protein
MKLKTTKDTVFFRELDPEKGLRYEKSAHKGYEVFVSAYKTEGGLLKFTLDTSKYPVGWLASFHYANINTWYVPKEDVEDPEGYGPSNNPKDVGVGKAISQGIPLKFPGFMGTYYSGNSITNFYDAPVNFTWGEAFHVRSENDWRKPVNSGIVYNVIEMAKELQAIRAFFGNKPIIITSWYRDPVTNKRVGGASQSRHLTGDAIDFYIPGMTTREIFNKLDPVWGNKGGLAYATGFVHIDKRGYKARWDY